jgi:molybdenum cofactor cytidylyltransferase
MSNYLSSASGAAGPENTIPIIILAAGSSSRLGQSKQLLEVNGKTLLHKIAGEAIRSNTGPVVVVLGSAFEQHQAVLSGLPLHVLRNSAWQTGMGSSIKSGIRYVQQTFPEATGVILSVCDQPFLNAGHFQQLTEYFRTSGKKIVACRYATTFGVPVFFSAAFFPLLTELPDGAGAKKIVADHLPEAAFIAFPGGEYDVDTPEDWAKVNQRL